MGLRHSFVVIFNFWAGTIEKRHLLETFASNNVERNSTAKHNLYFDHFNIRLTQKFIDSKYSLAMKKELFIANNEIIYVGILLLIGMRTTHVFVGSLSLKDENCSLLNT
ncbi:hypothetical protein H5410_028904 [Solanum commersonii]|uniref:Uncharacterized protein n=1 Tax=Solanum commersonii TaxID=4109 RepID=A0A9J5Z7H7_SOLCO|nr:hypothetical protein H5410_028904 [Solanum commersonii]